MARTSAEYKELTRKPALTKLGRVAVVTSNKKGTIKKKISSYKNHCGGLFGKATKYWEKRPVRSKDRGYENNT